jgi:hypothetical protein
MSEVFGVGVFMGMMAGLFAGMSLERYRRRDEKPEMATCCGKSLSEWFVDPAAGMICFVCKRTHPFLTHQEFRGTGKEGEK